MVKKDSSTPKKRKTRTVGSWRERNVRRVTDAIKFLERLNEDLARSGASIDDGKSAVVYLQGLLKELEAVDDAWKPNKKSGGGGALQPGVVVALKDDCAEVYNFLPKLEERMVGAVVQSVFSKTSVVVKLNDGQQHLFQKCHLARE
jgi:hypothetical protein